jgi:hypothetical protein
LGLDCLTCSTGGPVAVELPFPIPPSVVSWTGTIELDEHDITRQWYGNGMAVQDRIGSDRTREEMTRPDKK